MRNGVKFMVIPLEDAVRMASEILGVFEKGSIASGADADLVVLSTVGVVEETIVAGETVYHGRGRAKSAEMREQPEVLARIPRCARCESAGVTGRKE